MKRSLNWALSFMLVAMMALGIMAVFPRTARAQTLVVNNVASFNAAINSIYDDPGPHTIDLRINGLTFGGGIVIDGKAVTLKLNGFTLNIRNPEGDGLRIINSGSLTLSGAGTLNVTGDLGNGVSLIALSRIAMADTCALNANGANYGVYAKDSTITMAGEGVLNANGTNRGVCAVDSSTITLTGSGVFNAVGFSEAGVYAAGAKTKVQVTNATGGGSGSSGAAAHSRAKVEVAGNVTGFAYGAIAGTGGEITINGMILFSGKYINVDKNRMPLSDYAAATTKSGYLTYQGTDSTIWVRDQNYLTGADITMFIAHGEVTGKRINVYKYEKLTTTLFRLNRGDAFTLLNLANGGKALLIESDGREGYITIRDIRSMFSAAICATSLKKASAYILQENGKYKRAGYFDKGQELLVHGIEGKYFINKQKDTTYYLDPSQWVLAEARPLDE